MGYNNQQEGIHAWNPRRGTAIHEVMTMRVERIKLGEGMSIPCLVIAYHDAALFHT